MIGGTVVEYGKNPRGGDFDFALYHCTTHGVTQEAVFDESGTDMLYYRITVRVTGLVHGNLSWTKYQKRQSQQSTSSAAYETRGLRASLDNRQTFRMRMGVTDDENPSAGAELVYAEPYPDTAVPPAGGMLHWDVNDGPRCEVFGVEHVSGNNVFKVSATFTVCVVECDPATYGSEAPGTARNNKAGILSNRWSSSDDIDVNYLTTRTYSGRLRVASSKFNSHLMRAIVVPPLLKGLRRDRMSFTVSVDGKTMDWTVTDREVVTAAPFPARTWDISHNVDTDMAMLSSGSCTVRLTGDRTSNPRQMISIAFYVIREKLYSAGATITKRISVQTDTGDQNTVRVSCDVQSVAKKIDGNIGLTILAAYTTVGKPITLAQLQQQGPAYNPDISRGANNGDNVDIDGPVHLTGIFHARLQTPCDDDHKTDPRNSQYPYLSPWPPEQPGAVVNSGTGPEVDVRIVDDVWSEQNPYELSQGHIGTPYTSYTSESLYDTSGMMAAMPIARAGTTAAPISQNPYPPTTAPILNSGSISGSSSEDTVKVVRLSAPVSKRIVRVRAERVGDWPLMPTPVNYQLYAYQVGSGNVAAGRAIVNDVKFLPGTTDLTPTGQKIYRAAVDIEYLLTRQVDASQPLRVGGNPWDTLGLQLTTGAAMFANEQNPTVAGA